MGLPSKDNTAEKLVANTITSITITGNILHSTRHYLDLEAAMHYIEYEGDHNSAFNNYRDLHISIPSITCITKGDQWPESCYSMGDGWCGSEEDWLDSLNNAERLKAHKTLNETTTNTIISTNKGDLFLVLPNTEYRELMKCYYIGINNDS